MLRRRFGLFASLMLAALVGLGNSGCGDSTATRAGAAASREMEKTLYLQRRMIDSVPVPDLKTSAERQAVARRAKTWNNEDKLSYVYLIDSGRVMAFYVARGKVSSLNSYLNNEEQIIRQDVGSVTVTDKLPAPDIDGTYGHNVEGVFFFTDSGAYVEWNGRYICSDQPLKIAQDPLLTREVK